MIVMEPGAKAPADEQPASPRVSSAPAVNRILHGARHAVDLVRQGHGDAAVRAARTRLHSRSRSFGLRRDLTVAFSVPAAKIELSVRPLSPDDDLTFLDIEPGLAKDAAWTRLNQRRLIGARIPTCWVALDQAGKIAYMQWLIGASDNHRIQAQWGDLFPRLSREEALLEGAYTPEAYRGQGIMPHAMGKIAEAARSFGVRWVLTFVADHNIPSLKGCKKAGFAPYVERQESWTLFRRNMTFTPLPEGTPYSFES